MEAALIALVLKDAAPDIIEWLVEQGFMSAESGALAKDADDLMQFLNGLSIKRTYPTDRNGQ